MRRRFTLEYWLDDGWYVGRLKEVPGVFTQGVTLHELEENIQEVYELMLSEGECIGVLETQTKEVELEVQA
jgi:predicted RNase H-like HicB family nuclease